MLKYGVEGTPINEADDSVGPHKVFSKSCPPADCGSVLANVM